MEPDNQEPINQEERPTTVEGTNQLQPEEGTKPSEEKETKEEATKKPAKSKGLIVLVIIFAILAAGGIGFGIWAIMNNNQQPAPAPAPEPTEPVEPSEPVNEEVELTDANIIKDLDQKIAWLHIIDDTNSTFTTMRGHPEYPLYRQNSVSEKYKQFTIFRSLMGNQSRTARPEEVATLKANYPEYSDFIDDAINFSDFYVIDFDIFNNRYVDLFGEEFDDTTPNETGCPNFRYDKATKLVFDIGPGCGDGTSAVVTYFSKAKYTTIDDYVYVYINAVTVDYDPEEIYCTAFYWWGESAPQPCGTLSTSANASTVTYETYKEYGDRTTYRFVFKKADNGTYYFEKVEKIS